MKREVHVISLGEGRPDTFVADRRRSRLAVRARVVELVALVVVLLSIGVWSEYEQSGRIVGIGVWWLLLVFGIGHIGADWLEHGRPKRTELVWRVLWVAAISAVAAASTFSDFSAW